jgi:toxin CptA
MKAGGPLAVALKPSRRLFLFQVVAHALAAGAVLAATVPSWLMALLLLPIAISLARMRRKARPAGLILRADGGLEIVGADGTASDAVLHPHSLVLSFLVVLLYRQEGSLHALTLLGDSVTAEDFRQVRLWLRWRSMAAQPN